MVFLLIFFWALVLFFASAVQADTQSFDVSAVARNNYAHQWDVRSGSVATGTVLTLDARATDTTPALGHGKIVAVNGEGGHALSFEDSDGRSFPILRRAGCDNVFYTYRLICEGGKQ